MIFEFNFNKSITFKREKHNPIKRITIDLTNNQENKELNTEKKKIFISYNTIIYLHLCVLLYNQRKYFFS